MMVVAHSDVQALAMGLWSLVEGSEHVARFCLLCDNPYQKRMMDVLVCVEGELDTVPVCESCVLEYLGGGE
jgi:hypothetical protein